MASTASQRQHQGFSLGETPWLLDYAPGSELEREGVGVVMEMYSLCASTFTPHNYWGYCLFQIPLPLTLFTVITARK
jgi:hypothetical protein